MTTRFPTDWRTALVLVPHPDDPEYGMAAAVHRWTSEGKRVIYTLATSGEAGIEGMPPEECGPVREDEQRRSAAHVGVDVVEFLGFPDSQLVNDEALRAAVHAAIERHHPEVIITIYTGEEYGPGMPNQSDHINFGNTVAQVVAERGGLLFETAPSGEHTVELECEDVEAAVASLAEHEQYLSVLDPGTPVAEQARRQVDMSTIGEDGARRSTFILRASTPG
ncbi:MAG: PIG-L family deacetylase [Propionibacteriaceae bacterium]|nr:PIG-L family deacetylase [Propionibacteriaceae bacterium]